MDRSALTGGPAATDPVDLLVAGAGPAGLALALQAAVHGARVRVVERRPDAFRPSRAMILHPRTLEVLRPLGVTDELLDRAAASRTVQVHLTCDVFLEGGTVAMAACHTMWAGPRVQSGTGLPPPRTAALRSHRPELHDAAQQE